jgi:hypothetical protein
MEPRDPTLDVLLDLDGQVLVVARRVGKGVLQPFRLQYDVPTGWRQWWARRRPRLRRVRRLAHPMGLFLSSAF